MTDTNYKFIIYPPENQLGRLLNRWVKEIDAETDDKFTVDDSLNDENISLLVCLGDDSLNKFIEKLELQPSLNDKVIYHIGGIKSKEIRLDESVVTRDFPESIEVAP